MERNNKPITQDYLQHCKIAPSAIDMEEAVLGSMILESNSLNLVIDILKPETFYKEVHQKIYTAILSLFAKSIQIDMLSLVNELKATGMLEIVGGPYYVTQLCNRVASSANIEYHTRIVIQKYIQRELIRISTEITRDAYEDSTDVLELLDKAEKSLFDIHNENLKKKGESIRELVLQVTNDIAKAQADPKHFTGIPTGYTELDRILRGLKEKEVVIIAARPSLGKTALALQIAKNIAISFQYPVAIFSLEMSGKALAKRLVSNETGFNSYKIESGRFSDSDWDEYYKLITSLIESNIFIEDAPAINILDLKAKLRRLVQKHGIKVAIIDYLQLMTSLEKNANREVQVASISRGIKTIAMELDIPIILLSQLSRNVEQRGGSKKPMLSDLRESGAIEQDADIVCFMWNDSFKETQADIELFVAKNRNGATGDLTLKFIKSIGRFFDMDDINYDNMSKKLQNDTEQYYEVNELQPLTPNMGF